MKYLNFRFDVDTHKCIQEGVPNLLALAKKHKVHFTYFINLGRSVDQFSVLKAKLGIHSDHETYDNLSALEKLGVKDYLIAALLNPKIESVGSSIIKRAFRAGEEIGLHGGRNHERWNQEALTWNSEKIQSEIEWGLKKFSNIHPSAQITGFASPHWKGNRSIYKVLKRKEFTFVSDIHTNKPVQKIENIEGLKNVPVNIAGEPGGVGYLEWCRAKGFSDSELLFDFKKKLKKRPLFATVYDHPYYSGVKELDMLSQMIEIGKSEGYKVVSLSTISKLK